MASNELAQRQAGEPALPRLAARSRPAAVEVRDLAKRYGGGPDERLAIKDISFSVAPGECLALLGPNGAGKSTTIKILATLLRPDGGRASVAGHDVTENPAEVRRVLGVALQDTGLPRRQTAQRLLWYHARLQGLGAGEGRRRVAELLETFDLLRLADRSIETYSGGERRRLDIALALVHRPSVLLLDEPTAGLDIDSRRLIWRQLETQLDLGSALLFTTHDLHEADAQARRIAFIRAGALVAHSTPQELKRNHGPRTIEVQFDTVRDVAEATRALSGARSSEPLGLLIDVPRSADIVEVLRQLAAQNIEPRTISVVEPTLEMVFDRIVSQGAAAEPDRRA